MLSEIRPDGSVEARVGHVDAAREIQRQMHHWNDRAHAAHSAQFVAIGRLSVLRLGERRHVPGDIVAPALQYPYEYLYSHTNKSM